MFFTSVDCKALLVLSKKKIVPKSFGEAVSSASLIVRIIQIVERLRRIFSSLDQLGVCELKEAVNYMKVLSN